MEEIEDENFLFFCVHGVVMITPSDPFQVVTFGDSKRHVVLSERDKGFRVISECERNKKPAFCIFFKTDNGPLTYAIFVEPKEELVATLQLAMKDRSITITQIREAGSTYMI